MRAHKFDLSSQPLTPESVKSYDALILATDHEKFDYDILLDSASLIVDTRGKFDKNAKNVVRA
jgi:UDP-N-acetyl-D-glucosamine dehydrogenase